MLPKYRQQPPKPPDEEFSSQMVIPSSTELFSFYRLTFAQCAKLSTGARLVELSKVFAKYLDQYAQQILFYYISERPTGQTPSKTPIIEDLVLVLNTADYCFSTCTQLEEKIKGRVDESLKEAVDLQSQADAFMGIASASIRSLVRKIEIDLEPSWREMRNTGWSKLQTVNDQSSYVGEMLEKIKARAAEILAMLNKQQYARAFCDNLVELLANAFISSIVQCRPISEVGAEQMLLDSYALTQAFSSLISPSNPSYTKRVTNIMSRVSPILKTLQVRPSPPEALVQAYLIHIADKSDANFKKVLDLKGVAKKDQAGLLELFIAHKTAKRHEGLPMYSAVLTPLVITSGPASGGATGLASLGASAGNTLSAANLPTRFDPSTFGTALMTAARDGVDRFGSPALGVSASGTAAGSRTTSPPPALQGHNGEGTGNLGAGTSTNVNQNLKNIGKFFKRDLSGFGGRFGGARAGSDEVK